MTLKIRKYAFVVAYRNNRLCARTFNFDAAKSKYAEKMHRRITFSYADKNYSVKMVPARQLCPNHTTQDTTLYLKI